MTRIRRLGLVATILFLSGLTLTQVARSQQDAPAPSQGSGVKIDAKTNTGHVTGTVSVKNDTVEWHLKLRDEKADDEAVYLVVSIGKKGENDTFNDVNESRRTTGGKVLPFDGKKTIKGANSASIQICQDRKLLPDSCKQAAFVAEQ